MGLVTRWFSSYAQQDKAGQHDYIDLTDYATAGANGGSAETLVRVAEIRKYDDLRELAGYVYDGDMLVLDFSKVLKDEILLKRVSNDLRKLAQDVDGDIAGIGDAVVMVTPRGTKVHKRKIRAGEDG